MQIAHIYPVKNQEMYQKEEFVMILAHLLKKGLYDPGHFQKGKHIIMDNGLYEGEQVSTDLIDLINLAEDSKIPITEIVIPDAVNDLDQTIALFEKNLYAIQQWQHKYQFMFVAQAETYGQLFRAIKYINQYEGMNLSVGVSKLTPLNRKDDKAIRCYEDCKFPIHLLGIKKSFSELAHPKFKKLIRSCDTSQIAFIDKNEPSTPSSIINYVRKGKDIDLEHDYGNSMRMSMLLNLFNKEAFVSELL